jgi:predicted esterase
VGGSMNAAWRRSVFLSVAVFGLLASAVAGTAVPASAAPAANPYCNTPVFFGLHGVGEGPSSTDSKLAPELTGFDDAQNQISGAVLADLVSYTTVSFSALDLLPDNPQLASDVYKAVTAVSNGVSQLDKYFNNWISGCQIDQPKIALVGYSMGAWVINDWLDHNPGDWIYIKAVVLYGDPCWIDGADKGLVRAAGIAGVAGLVGCMSARTYPYPAATDVYTPHFKTQSWCVGGDPVCGGGFKGKLAKMVKGGLGCLADTKPPYTRCPHYWYRTGEPAAVTLKDGAQLVVSQLVG